MGMRRAHRVRLTAPSDALVRRGVFLLEDAMRTASLAEADGGALLLVRSLPVGIIHSEQSPASVALAVERSFQRVRRVAVHAGCAAADTSPAVYFRDQIEALVALTVRLVRVGVAREWYWPLIAPTVSLSPFRRSVFVDLLIESTRTRAGPAGGIAYLYQLHDRAALESLLAALDTSDGPRLLMLFGWSPAFFRNAAPAVDWTPDARISIKWRRNLSRAVHRWGRSDDRSVWLASVVAAIARCGDVGDVRLPMFAHHLLEDVKATTDRSERELNVVNPSRPGQTSPARDAERFEYSGTPTRGAGLLFLVPLMSRLGIAELCNRRTELQSLDFPRRVLRDVVRRLRMDPQDGVMEVLADTQSVQSDASEPTDDLPLMRRVWVAALWFWCRRYALIPLRELVHRPGRVRITPTHVDVMLDHKQSDTRIRKAGLDIDPGWVPWLGRVVQFHYLYGEDGHDAA